MSKLNMTTKPALWLAAIAFSLAPQTVLAEKKPTDHSNKVEKSGSIAFEGSNWSDTSVEMTDTNVTMDLGGEEGQQAGSDGQITEPVAEEPVPEATGLHLEEASAETSCATEVSEIPTEASVYAGPAAEAAADGAREVNPATEAAGEPNVLCADTVEGVPMMLTANGEVVPIASDVPTSVILAGRLAERRTSLDNREASLGDREALLAAAEKRIEERSAELTQQLAELQAASTASAEEEGQDLKNLVAMYETMKPSQAAAIFDKLDVTNLQLIAEAMNPRKLAPIMAKMDPKSAAALTIGIAQ